MIARLAPVAVACGAICYGTYALFGRLLVDAGVTISGILFWRFVLAGAFLWIVVALTRGALPNARSRGVAVLLGIFYAMMSTTYLLTLVHLGAAYAVLLLCAYPAVVVAIEHFLGSRITRERVAAVALAICGVALLVHPGQHLDGLGVAVGLASAISYGVYLVVASRAMRTMPPLAGTAVVATATAIAFGIGAFVLRTGVAIPSTRAFVLLSGAATLATAIPIVLLAWGIVRVGAPRTAVLGTLEPLVGVILVMIVTGERLDVIQLLGGALLVASCIVPDRPLAVPLEA